MSDDIQAELDALKAARRRQGELTDEQKRRQNRLYVQRHRQRNPQPPRKLKPCPSYTAYRRHQAERKNGRPSTCTDPEGCQQAARKYLAERQAARRR